MSLLPHELINLIARYPGRTAWQLCRILAENGCPGVDKRQLNQALYSEPRLYWVPGRGSSRLWYASSPAEDRLDLYPWQQEALDWWAKLGYKGVIEAVTGAGKTRVALAAIAQQLVLGYPSVIVVPTKELLYQWEREARTLLGNALSLRFSIGMLGDGQDDIRRAPDILIATASSACHDYLIPYHETGLIIADEVHRYGAPQWSKALEQKFNRRLGLTATYEREDSGKEEYLDPYFAGNVFSVGYERALDEGVIAPFKIAFIGVKFSGQESKDYEEFAEKASRYRSKLIQKYDLPEEPFGEFMRGVNILRQGGGGEATRLARSYLNAFTRRRQALANAAEKFERVGELADAVRAAERSILFAQTKAAAERAAARLTSQGVSGAVLDSGMDMSERKEVFAGFEDGEHELVAAPRLLDEGIDVPAADLAIVLASNRSRRQMVQRMGRVVRKKLDARLARLVVLYVEETTEDPRVGANEDFIYLVTDAAYDIEHFDSTTSMSEITNYLNDWYA